MTDDALMDIADALFVEHDKTAADAEANRAKPHFHRDFMWCELADDFSISREI